MTQHMLTPPSTGFVDPRKAGASVADPNSHISTGLTIFTANATGGSTTTLVGDNAAPATGVNVVRAGEKFKLYDSTGALKEDTVFTVDSIAVAAETTVTFSPAAAAATASGDYAVLLESGPFDSVATLDKKLIATGVYTQAMCDSMSMNDKVYAYRVTVDPTSI